MSYIAVGGAGLDKLKEAERKANHLRALQSMTVASGSKVLPPPGFLNAVPGGIYTVVGGGFALVLVLATVVKKRKKNAAAAAAAPMAVTR